MSLDNYFIMSSQLDMTFAYNNIFSLTSDLARANKTYSINKLKLIFSITSGIAPAAILGV